jgi:hypothetical protein
MEERPVNLRSRAAVGGRKNALFLLLEAVYGLRDFVAVGSRDARRGVLEKLSAIRMLDVCLPTTDGRLVALPRYTQPETAQKLILEELKLELPPQPPSRIRARAPALSPAEKMGGGSAFVVET